jgi:hypothetical protein
MVLGMEFGTELALDSLSQVELAVQIDCNVTCCMSAPD